MPASARRPPHEPERAPATVGGTGDPGAGAGAGLWPGHQPPAPALLAARHHPDPAGRSTGPLPAAVRRTGTDRTGPATAAGGNPRYRSLPAGAAPGAGLGLAATAP